MPFPNDVIGFIAISNKLTMCSLIDDAPGFLYVKSFITIAQ